MTTQTIAEQGAFTAVGAIDLDTTTWYVATEHATTSLPNTWSITTGPGLNLATWQTTDPDTAHTAILSASVTAILAQNPGPVVNWKDHTLATGRVVQEAHVATITTTHGNRTHLTLRYDPTLNEAYGDPFEPGDVTFTEHPSDTEQVVTLPVPRPDHVDLVAAIDRANTKPSGGLLS